MSFNFKVVGCERERQREANMTGCLLTRKEQSKMERRRRVSTQKELCVCVCVCVCVC